MIIFEDQLARIVEILPPLTSGDKSQIVRFNWGLEDVLRKYLTLFGKLSFPLVWLVEGVDQNDLIKQIVTRKATILVLYESQAPNEFNPYQHEYDFNVILQPITDNLIKALKESNISLIDSSKLNVRRHKNYVFEYTKEHEKSSNTPITYICNAIQIDVNVTFKNVKNCIGTINFN